MPILNKKRPPKTRVKRAPGRKLSENSKILRRAEMKASREKMEPLDYMLRVMHDPRAGRKRRDDMAKAAAPFRHPRLMTNKIVGGNPADGDQPLSHRFEIVLVRSNGDGAPAIDSPRAAAQAVAEDAGRAIETTVKSAVAASEEDGDG
jgi:hypothetical protein